MKTIRDEKRYKDDSIPFTPNSGIISKQCQSEVIRKGYNKLWTKVVMQSQSVELEQCIRGLMECDRLSYERHILYNKIK